MILWPYISSHGPGDTLAEAMGQGCREPDDFYRFIQESVNSSEYSFKPALVGELLDVIREADPDNYQLLLEMGRSQQLNALAQLTIRSAKSVLLKDIAAYVRRVDQEAKDWLQQPLAEHRSDISAFVEEHRAWIDAFRRMVETPYDNFETLETYDTE